MGLDPLGIRRDILVKYPHPRRREFLFSLHFPPFPPKPHRDRTLMKFSRVSGALT